MSRWRNYGLWVSLFGFLIMVCQSFKIIELPENIEEIVNALLVLLVTAGIISNPTDGTGYLDTKKPPSSNSP